MNKLTKVGLSALCGSLAATAVNAGSMSVSGGATVTWTSLGTQETGNPLGMDSGLTFKGEGELDGGQTFSVSLVDTDKSTWSSSNITLNTNSGGTFILSSAEGGQGIGGYDDNMPRAYEEVWDTAVSTNVNLQKGVGSSTNISWTSPEVMGSKVQIAYAPDNDGAQNVNKAVSGAASNHFGSGWDIVLDLGSGSQWDSGGFNLIVGGSETKVAKSKVGGRKAFEHDHQEAVVGLTLTLGPVQLGGQVSAERIPNQTPDGIEAYGNKSWGLAFNVNDDLSVSYSQTRHVQLKAKKQSWALASDATLKSIQGNEYTPKSWMRGDSIQASWTVGGIGLSYAQTNYDNTAYTYDSKAPLESKILAVSLAF